MNLIFDWNVLTLKAGMVYVHWQQSGPGCDGSNHSLRPAWKQIRGPMLITCVLFGWGVSETNQNKNTEIRLISKT